MTGSDGAECGLTETSACETLYHVLFAVDSRNGTVTNVIHVDYGTYQGRNNREIDFENVPDVNNQVVSNNVSFIVPITIQLWDPASDTSSTPRRGGVVPNTAIFDAEGKSSLFIVTGPVSLTLNNLTFINGNEVGMFFVCF